MATSGKIGRPARRSPIESHGAGGGDGVPGEQAGLAQHGLLRLDLVVDEDLLLGLVQPERAPTRAATT